MSGFNEWLKKADYETWLKFNDIEKWLDIVCERVGKKINRRWKRELKERAAGK